MTLFADESGKETSIPREGIEITIGDAVIPIVYRIATGTRNIVIDGQIYRAEAGARGEAKIAAAANQTDMVIELPLAHPVPQRYMQSGVPPRAIRVNVWRKQVTSGEAEIIWRGLVTSMAIDSNHVAKLLVPARLSRALRRRVPTITGGRLCPHILYDRNCRVVKDDFKLVSTVTYVSGRIVRIVEPYPDGFAKWGELKHVLSGESVTVMDQTTTGSGPYTVHITVQLPINGVQVGHQVELYAGCAHTIAACRTKFDNVANFGGFPNMPFINVMGFTGTGFNTNP